MYGNVMGKEPGEPEQQARLSDEGSSCCRAGKGFLEMPPLCVKWLDVLSVSNQSD